MSGAEPSELLVLGDRTLAAVTRRASGIVAECIVRASAELSAKVRMGNVELVEEVNARAVSLRVIRANRAAMVSTSDVSDAGLNRLVDDALDLVDLTEPDPFLSSHEASPLHEPGSSVDLELYDPAVATLGTDACVARAAEMEAAALGIDPRVSRSDGALCKRSHGSLAYAFSSGFRAAYRTSSMSLRVTPVALDEGGKLRRGSRATMARHLGDLESGASIGADAARRAITKIGSQSVATCEIPVVFAPEAGRGILALLGQCVMGSAIWRRSSYLVGREASLVASSLVNVIDDPLVPRAAGSRPFDGEGLSSRTNVVVERGILRTYLCDGYAARKLGRASTGNALRGASAGVAGATTNFILLPGDASPESIVKETRQGFYVTELMGYGFNALTGNFSRGASGIWIEGGELTYPVSEVTISLPLDDLLQRIDGVASDLKPRAATTVPTFRVERMTVAGTGAPRS